jgi:GT2 family glycosyltransferase
MSWLNPHLRDRHGALKIEEIVTRPVGHISGRPTVAILLNTIDRYDLTVRCIGGALASAGYPFEFLCCDNGSSDRRVIDYIAKFAPVYFRQNTINEGCAQMHNQMLLRTKADLFCLLDNDIEIKHDKWLRALVETYEVVEGSGVIGVYTDGLGCERHAEVHAKPSDTAIHLAVPPKEDAVFGTRLFSRTVLDKVGFFCEDYGPYGLCDNEYNSRVHHSGFSNYYITGPGSGHLGIGSEDTGGYRRMKDDVMQSAQTRFRANMKRYFDTGDFYVPAPELR